MLSIACLSQKGGVGKSTLARLLAVIYARNGWAVKIADFNVKQTTSVDWNGRRLSAGLEPSIAAEAYTDIRQAMRTADKYDLIVFDGKPESDKISLDIAKLASLVIIPVGGTIDDLLPQLRFAKELTDKDVEKAKLLFVIIRSTDSAIATREAQAYIADAGFQVAENDIQQRTGYQTAQNGGRAICETTFPSLNERTEALAQEVGARFKAVTESAS